MPQVVTSNTRTIKYSKEEIQQLIHEDLMKKGMSKSSDKVIEIRDIQKPIGDMPRGNFDSDTIYGFGGISITIQE